MRTMYVLCKHCGKKIWVKSPPKSVLQQSVPKSITVKSGESAHFSFATLKYDCRKCGQVARYLPNDLHRWWQIGR
jgi:DNA-directed RNA polymerase subunit RPC12/RpoP